MCGIAGIINKKGKKIEKNDIQKMIDIIAHRGPDAEGVYLDESFGVGHRRLSIVDLSKEGTQPMTSADGKYVISFNGEIYNYIEIRDELKAEGVKFHTKTDTEVIIEAYRMWGTACTKFFNGMWAFAIYDNDKKTVFLSRDRFGVKPLYMLERQDEVVFASEIKCILELFPEEKQVDETTLVRYFNYIQEDGDEHTFYKNIKNFPKAHNMIINLKDNTSSIESYWKIDKESFRHKWNTKNPYKQFRELFEDAIRIRLRADVPIGASLSGGLDSSSIVCVAKKKFGVTMNTFSSIYEEEDCNEEEFIDCVNREAKAIKHYIYPENSENILEDIKSLIYFHDGPCEEASPYSGFCVYRGVGDTVKVLLDGQGADELFAGYLSGFAMYIKDLVEQGQIWSRLKAVKVAASFKEAIPMHTSQVGENELVQILGYRGYKKYTKKFLKSNPKNKNISSDIWTDKFKSYSTEAEWEYPEDIKSNIEKLLYTQFNHCMLPRILHDVDRNSMAHSLEVRLPFLDYRIVEFSYALDSRYKIRNSWSKYIVRRGLKKYLPKKIYSRRNKMGFPAPFDVWIRDQRYKTEFKEYIDKFAERGIVHKKILMDYYKRHLDGENYKYFLFKVIATEMWLEEWIDTEEKMWVLE